MNISRWSILVLDAGIVAFSIVLAHLLRFNFEVEAVDYVHFPTGPILLLGIRILTFFLFKTYTGIIFHTGLEDAQRIFLSLMVWSLAFAIVLNPIVFWQTNHYILPYSILIIEFLVSGFLLTGYRGLVKVLYWELATPQSETKSVIVYGAGAAGVVVKNVLEKDIAASYSIAAFIDDNEQLQSKRLLGIEVYARESLSSLLKEHRPEMLIFSTMAVPADRRQSVVEVCLEHQVKVLNIPPVSQWINGELSFSQIRKVRIEDLLERDPIQLDQAEIEAQIRAKVVLITGAAGSIGSELVRQVIQYHPKKLILLDQAETPLYEIELSLRSKHQFSNFEIMLGDVRNQWSMERIFEQHQPEVIYHAAAYKHVPMMENHPSEAVLTNVWGTKVLADLAQRYNSKKFVLVSTDKAVNPSSVMGASKRIAEIYVQSLDRSLAQAKKSPKFVTTRFGNVLGSNGSVIPLFKKQIRSGGPLTITHPEMTRYFMTIPEACQLVMEAGAMGKGGEIFVFDMGKSIKILDLAKRMIRLSGLQLGKDIHITFTGLRPGEKLYEELLNQAETTLPTHHKKIMIAKVREYPFTEVAAKIDALLELIKEQNEERMVRAVKALVPEFKSQNSIYEKFDQDS
ncbi:MAG: nucleoside-diphosphate sugar epimerase/dehydratase [Bacteroidota bacterium]